MKQTREHGLTVGFVSVTERKHVVDWLEGKTSDQDRVVPLDCPPDSPPRPTGQALSTTPRAEVPTTSPSKRRLVADPHDLEIVKKMRQNEVELHDRNTVLRGIKSNVSVGLAIVRFVHNGLCSSCSRISQLCGRHTEKS